MSRLNEQRQKKMEPMFYAYAKNLIEHKGYIITKEEKTYFEFTYNDSTVRLFPYSGWHSGKSIEDGRGLQKLLDQLPPKYQNAIIVTGISDHVNNSLARKQTRFKITAEGRFYFMGKWITEKEFYDMHPTGLKQVNYKGENKDGTRV